jgi:hypothetical protein
MLGESDALDGVKFLGVDRLIDGDEVGAEGGDFVGVLDADGGESRGFKAMLGLGGHALLFAWGASRVARRMAENAGNEGNIIHWTP